MTYVIGIDPGPVVGIVGLWIEAWSGLGVDLTSVPRGAHVAGNPNAVQRIERVDVVQCSAGCVKRALEGLWLPTSTVAAERFAPSRLGSRANAPQASLATRSVLTVLAEWAQAQRVPYVERSAAEVKPWATDQRLVAAKLLAPTMGMRHARDAARHALYAAVKDCGMRDPLSARAGVA